MQLIVNHELNCEEGYANTGGQKNADRGRLSSKTFTREPRKVKVLDEVAIFFSLTRLSSRVNSHNTGSTKMLSSITAGNSYLRTVRLIVRPTFSPPFGYPHFLYTYNINI